MDVGLGEWPLSHGVISLGLIEAFPHDLQQVEDPGLPDRMAIVPPGEAPLGVERERAEPARDARAFVDPDLVAVPRAAVDGLAVLVGILDPLQVNAVGLLALLQD